MAWPSPLDRLKRVSRTDVPFYSFLVSCWCIVIALSGCGYRFSGGGALPANVKRVFIPVFENRTSEAGIETRFASDLIDQFTRARLTVVSEEGSAEAFLTGVIRTLSIETLSHGDPSAAAERRLTVTVDIRLVSRSGEVLKAYRGLSESETFDVSPGLRSLTEKNQQNALALLSSRLSEAIYKMLTDDF